MQAGGDFDKLDSPISRVFWRQCLPTLIVTGVKGCTVNRLAKTAMHAAVTLALLGASHLAQAGYKEGMDALGVRDFAKARAEFEADAGNPKAQLELVRMLRQGIGGDRMSDRHFLQVR